jgi:putative xylitol transport system substrate-binding protein
MKKILFILIVVIFIASLSCHRSRGLKVKVGISVANMNEEEYIQIKKGMEMAPDSIKNDSELYWLSADNDVKKQEEQVKKLVDEVGVDVLILNCVSEYRAKTMLEPVEKEEIPVVSINNIPVCRQVFCYVTPDYFFAGKFQAQYVVTKLNARGRVIILSGNTYSDVYATMTSRNKDVLEKFGNISIVYQKYFNNKNDAGPIVDSLLKFYKNEIQAIIANTDELALEAVKVLKEKNLEKKIITVGAGCTLNGVKSILNDELTMSVETGTAEMGKEALIAASNLINLRPLNDNALKYKNGDFRAAWILSPVQAFDKSNIMKLINEKHKFTPEQVGLK